MTVHEDTERSEIRAAIRAIADRDESLIGSNYIDGDYLRLADRLIRLGLKIRIDHTPVERMVWKEVCEHDVD